MADDPQRYVSKVEFYFLLGSMSLVVGSGFLVLSLGHEKLSGQVGGLVIAFLCQLLGVMFIAQSRRKRKRPQEDPGQAE